LIRDGAPLSDDGYLLPGTRPPDGQFSFDGIDLIGNRATLDQHLARIEQLRDTDPSAVIGSSKELLESTCKMVLDRMDVAYVRSASIPDLYRLCAERLNISRRSASGSTKPARATQKLMSNMSVAVQCLAEIRNDLGTGHGRATPTAAERRDGALALNAARTVVEFISDSWAVAMVDPTHNAETFNSLIEAYVANNPRLKSPSSRERYGRELKKFADAVAPRAPGDVTLRDCEDWASQWKTSTRSVAVDILKGFFRWLEKHGVIEDSPAETLERSITHHEKKSDPPPTEHEVRLLLSACETWPERLCLNVLLATGAKKTAAAKLRWRDVDLDGGRLTVIQGPELSIVHEIPGDLRKLLHGYLDETGRDPKPEDFLIPNRRPTGRTERAPRIVYELVKNVAERVGLDVDPHSFRQVFALRFHREQPERLDELTRVLGHKGVERTAAFLERLKLAEATRGR
jgi:integrase